MSIKKWYLKIIFVIGVLAIIIQGLTLFSFKPEDKFVGLQLYSVRDDMKKDVKTTVEKVGAMGYKFVEAAGFSDGKFYGMDPVDFKKLCKTNGLQFLGSHSGQDLPDDANWDKTMAWWDMCIDAHAAAGVKWIVQPSMGEEAYNSLDGLKKYVEYFNVVGEKCKAKGIKFGYHNHSKEFTTVFEGKPIYDWMLELTDPKKVMFEMDLYWTVHGGKDPVDYFNKYPGRFMLWHIKDEKELGASGKMDFKTIFASKKKSGLKYGIVEVEKYDFEPLVSCKKSLEYMNTTNF
jgi:sugar phosphate isomerase/epimerase